MNGSRYIQVPSEAIHNWAKSKNMVQTTEGNEIVYVAKSGLRAIKFYTSIRVGNSTVRDCGKDAIRFVLRAYAGVDFLSKQKRVFTIGDEPRVYRTGTVDGVLSRIEERYQDLVSRAKDFRLICEHCGAVAHNTKGCINKKNCLNYRPMSPKQFSYMSSLAQDLGVEIPVAKTAAEAVKNIEELKKLIQDQKDDAEFRKDWDRGIHR